MKTDIRERKEHAIDLMEKLCIYKSYIKDFEEHCDHDSKPSEEILDFVNKKWLPNANRKIKQIAA